MDHTLEEDYRDFLEIQGMKGQVNIPRVARELQISEEELFEFVNKRLTKLDEQSEQGLSLQKSGELAGTCFLFGFWLRGVRGEPAQ